MRAWVVGIGVLLVGCASSQQVKTPTGEAAHQVKCGNAAKAACAQKAAEICPAGYTELERKPDPYADTTKIGTIGFLEVRADTTTTLLIRCK